MPPIKVNTIMKTDASTTWNENKIRLARANMMPKIATIFLSVCFFDFVDDA